MKKTVIILIHILTGCCVQLSIFFLSLFPSHIFTTPPTVFECIVGISIPCGLICLDYFVCRTIIRKHAFVFDKPVPVHTADLVLMPIVLLMSPGFIWLAVFAALDALQIMLRVFLIKLNRTLLISKYLKSE